MIGLIDSTVLTLLLCIGGILVLATVIAAMLGFAKRGTENSNLKNLNQRIAA